MRDGSEEALGKNSGLKWIHDSEDIGDQCYTCGTLQEVESNWGTYSLHSTDCEYVPNNAWVEPDFQDFLNKELKIYRENQKRIKSSQVNSTHENSQKSTRPSPPPAPEDPPLLKSLKNFGSTFAQLNTTFESDKAMTAISEYKSFLQNNPEIKNEYQNWITFLDKYTIALKAKIAP